jgi:hypothetical protein
MRNKYERSRVLNPKLATYFQTVLLKIQGDLQVVLKVTFVDNSGV